MPLSTTPEAVAGSQLFIALPNSQVFTEIKNCSNLGPIGTQFNKIAVESIGDGYTRQIKGTEMAPSYDFGVNLVDNDAGQQMLRTAYKNRNDFYNFKLSEGDLPTVVNASPITITIAAPGVVTYAAHGFLAGDALQFATTGTLPTGLLAGTTYYVKAVLDANTFTLSATPTGAAITTTGAQSGVHSLLTVPSATTVTFSGRVFGYARQYGGVNDLKKINSSIEIEPDSIVYTLAAQ